MSPEEEREALVAAGIAHKVRADIAERRLREAEAKIARALELLDLGEAEFVVRAALAGPQ